MKQYFDQIETNIVNVLQFKFMGCESKHKEKKHLSLFVNVSKTSWRIKIVSRNFWMNISIAPQSIKSYEW